MFQVKLFRDSIRTRCFFFVCLIFTLALPYGAQAGNASGIESEVDFKLTKFGLITQWMVAVPQSQNMNLIKTPPKDVASGLTLEDGSKWGVYVAETDFVDFRTYASGMRKGFIWAAARLHSVTGGARGLRVQSYGKMRVYLNGKLVIDKPAPHGFDADGRRVEVKLPKGNSEILVAVGIRYGYCGFSLGVAGLKTPGVAPGDVCRLAWAKVEAQANGAVPSRGALYTRALTFAVEDVFVAPEQSISLALGLVGGWASGVGAVTPRFKADGKVVDGTFTAKSPKELLRAPWRIKLIVPKNSGSSVKLTCELLANGKVLGVKQKTLYVMDGIRKEAEELKKRLETLEGTNQKRFPQTALALEKIDIWLDGLAPVPGSKRLPWEGADTMRQRTTPKVGGTLLSLLDRARKFLPLEAKGTDPLEGQTGYLERAYISKIDESVQPYFVYAPSAAKAVKATETPVKRFPLIVFLHGYVQEYHKHRWWTKNDGLNRICEKFGAFMAIPFARSNADFLGAGEVDVLDVLKEMKRRYPIDEDRVYLYGYSMGGMGVYSLGGHYPDLWAGGMVMAGRAYSPLLMGTRKFEDLKPFKQLLMRVDQPLDLCENFVNIPLRVYHGGDDNMIPVSEAKAIVDRLKAQGCDVRLSIRPGDHWFGFDLMEEDGPVEWLLEQRRKKSPAINRLKNYSLRFGKVRGLEVTHRGPGVNPLFVEWKKGTEGTLDVVAKVSGNVASLRNLDSKRNWVMSPKSKETLTGNRSNRFFFKKGWGPSAIKDSPARMHSEWKTPLRCGPVKEATYGPFMVVYGTQGGAEVARRLKAQAEGFAEDWYGFAKGFAKVKADTDVNDRDKASKNLILFGEEQENSVHAQAVQLKKLPFSVKDGWAKWGTKKVSLENNGILYIYPSPFNQGKQVGNESALRTIVISAGIRYGSGLPLNHKLDLVPDFLIYAAEQDDDGTRTNRPLVAGFFDGKWAFNETSTWLYMK